jgi:hypothetical protein
MNATITLLLTTRRGNEIGRLTVTGAAVAYGGDPDGPPPDQTTRRATAARMHGLVEHVRAALAAEGMEPLLTAVEFDTRIGEAVLLVAGQSRKGELLIPLPVGDLAASGGDQPKPAPDGQAPGPNEWDDLFAFRDPAPPSESDPDDAPHDTHPPVDGHRNDELEGGQP